MLVMDRTESAVSRLEALAARGLDADQLAREMLATVRSWRAEVDAQAARLKCELAARGVRHEEEARRALRDGMTAEGARQAAIATTLAKASQWQRPLPFRLV